VNRSALTILLCLTAVACEQRAPKAPAAPPPEKAPSSDVRPINAGWEEDLDADNLLNLAYGASVVSRTGESNLDLSAVQAIDGISTTIWSSPPGGHQQTIVFSLAARSRVDRLGVTASQDNIPKRLAFDSSLDGHSWHERLEQTPGKSLTPQMLDVKPFEARYIRVRVLEGTGTFTTVRSVHALGQELEQAKGRDFAGCWMINGLVAHLDQKGARLTGSVATSPPTFLEGGSDGRVARLVWLRAPNRGYVALTMDPTTQTLSGLMMYDNISSGAVADGWFGERCEHESKSELPGVRELGEILDRSNRLSLYGLNFDSREHVLETESAETLDLIASLIAARPDKKFLLVSHELRLDAPDQRTAARIASLREALQKRGAATTRIEFVAAGAKPLDIPIVAALQRLMGSRVDLELALPHH
jgi:hypothetical protein